MSVATPTEPTRTRVAKPSASLSALLAGLIDYAGLFPPAGLSMADAVRRYAQHREGPHAWALGRFVVPASRLAEFEEHTSALQGGGAGAPWQLSVLGGAADRPLLDEFNARLAGRVVPDVVEAKASTAAEAAAARALADRYTAYVEIPVEEDPEALVVTLARNGLRAKIRTGGVQASAFPRAAHVARFITRCVQANVAMKATAGLHHAWRGEHALTYEANSAQATMFGFLNMFVATVFAREGLPKVEVEALLEERRGRSVTFDDDGIAWRGLRVPVAGIKAARSGFAAAFGSCSFDEPMRELQSLGLL